MTPGPAATHTAPQGPRRLTGLPAPAAPRAMPTDTSVRILQAALRRELELRLRVPPAHRLGTDRPLRRQCVHPLLALQFKRTPKHGLEVEVPADLLSEGTLTEVATVVAAGLGASPAMRGGGP
ncbi:hypothetical protein [Streptomyces wuyuanensis]|uniref:hypothetical protein n=1 Tax=Streptomyces wuyuanensis TaxID=1196353 RepID=UPI003D73FB25